MFKYIPIQSRLLETIQQAEALKSKEAQHAADIDYIAMMTDVELEQQSKEEQEAEYIPVPYLAEREEENAQ